VFFFIFLHGVCYSATPAQKLVMRRAPLPIGPRGQTWAKVADPLHRSPGRKRHGEFRMIAKWNGSSLSNKTRSGNMPLLLVLVILIFGMLDALY
jgi:hypothetical protein